MAKKHPDRPALRAVDVKRWFENGILKVKQISQTPVLFLIEGKNVRQSWFRRRRGRVQRHSAVTYLGKGIFLIPIWLPVRDWEIEYLKSQDIDLRSRGIRLFDHGYLRLCYMQVEDLDHAERQQDHVLEGYSRQDYPPITADLEILMDELARVEAISSKIRSRKVGIDSVGNYLKMRLIFWQKNLNSWHRSLQLIVSNAPALQRETTLRERQPVITTLRRIADGCRDLTMRPVGIRLSRAARSLKLAAGHIQNGRLDLARDRIKSALKNLEYPEAN